MKRTFLIVMVNNSININKTNNYFPPPLIEHKKVHDIWRWKSRPWIGTGEELNRLTGSQLQCIND